MEPPATDSRVSVTPRWRFSLAPNSPSTLLSDAWLVQGMTMSHGIVNSLPGIGSGLRRPLASGGPRRVRWKTMPVTLPSFVGHHLDRRGEELEAHALEAGLVLLLLVDHHLLRAAAVDDGAGLGAEAQGGARRVHGRVAAADDHDVLADPLLLAQVGALQEVDAVDHAVELLAGDVHGDRVHAAGGDHDRVVALAQLVEGDVAPDLDVVVELHAVLGDPVDVQLDHVARQAERRHADQGGAAARGQRLVDVDLVAVGGQLLGDAPGRPARRR